MFRPIPIIIFLGLGTGAFFWFREGPATARNAHPSSGPIVAFGDSLTSGYGAPAGSNYVDEVSRRIGRPIINRGVGGNTIGEAHARLQQDVLALKPGIVIVLLGGNDYLRRGNLEAAFQDLEQMVQEIQNHGALVVLVGLESFIPFMNEGKRYKAIAGRCGCVYVPDIMDGVLGNRAMMSDQIHPNAAGYAIMGERVAKALKPYIQ